MKMSKYWFWITGIFSIVAIVAALVAENIFYIEPCSMCLKQRYPYYFIIVIFILFLFIRQFSLLWYFLMLQLASIYGLFYAIWHVGIEQNIIEGPASCSETLAKTSSIQDLKQQIKNKQ